MYAWQSKRAKPIRAHIAHVMLVGRVSLRCVHKSLRGLFRHLHLSTINLSSLFGRLPLLFSPSQPFLSLGLFSVSNSYLFLSALDPCAREPVTILAAAMCMIWRCHVPPPNEDYPNAAYRTERCNRYDPSGGTHSVGIVACLKGLIVRYMMTLSRSSQI